MSAPAPPPPAPIPAPIPANGVRILDRFGQAITVPRPANERLPQAPNGTPSGPLRPTALNTSSGVPYDAADISSEHMAAWQPYLWSPDGELNIYRDRIVARIRDVARNDGWGCGVITRIVDNAVGANFRPIPKPDWQALRYRTGLAGFDAGWAYEYRTALAASYRTWSREKWCHAQRNLVLGQIFQLEFRHKIRDGDAIAVLPWLPERCGPGRARYATTVLPIDPDRLSNPQLRFDSHTIRGGVEVDPDDYNSTVAYHFRKAHQGDWFSADKSVSWERIERETPWGRPIVVHDYDHDRADTHRGGAGVLAPVLHRLKMLIRYDVAELDAALLNAIFSAYIESPFDAQFVEEALGDQGALSTYQAERADFHDRKRIELAGSRMPILFPGEKINAVTAERPNGNFAAFEKAALRNVAAAAGLSAQQVSNDWSDVNYSSARGAMLEFWKTLHRRREDFATGFAQPVFSAFVEEAFAIDDLPLPAGAPPFEEFRAAYSHAKWIGPGKGWIDPVDEVKGAVLGMDAAVMDYDEICAEQGVDGDDMIAARAHTIKRFRDAGLEPPTWASLNPMGEPAQKTIQDPEAR